MLPAGKTPAHPRRRIGRYLVTGHIGRGGMGMVYRGLDEALEREVAVKTLTVEGTLDAESRRRFEIEAKAAAKLQHPNIVTVFELGDEQGRPFIAMELLQGADLETLIREVEPLLLQEQLETVAQVCRGLAFAHDKGIVHRDVKPSNIWLQDDGAAKILDFGIAKLGNTGVTKSGMMVGTVHYMSPEQIRGQTLDGRSDVFSLGVILHQLLAGRRPFGGLGPTEVLFSIVQEDTPRLPEPRKEIHRPVWPRLQAVVDKALQKDPDQRYAGADRMAEDVTAVLAFYERQLADVVLPVDAAAVTLSRRLVKDGRLAEGEALLRRLAEENPHLVEARRLLRHVRRELERRNRAKTVEDDEYPELDLTQPSTATNRSPSTAAGPRVPASLPSRRFLGRAAWIVGGTLTLLVAIGAGLWLLRRADSRVAPSSAPRASLRIAVRSKPAGAAILLDGHETGVMTDGEVAVEGAGRQVALTFRKSGFRSLTRTVSIPLNPGRPIEVSLVPEPVGVPLTSEPPGARIEVDGRWLAGLTPTEVVLDPSVGHRLVFVRDGQKPQEVKIDPSRVPPSVRVAFETAAAAGTVVISSSFPIDVSWKGQVLAKDQISPRISLPPGSQQLTLESRALFLKATRTVDVRSGAESSAEAPAAGKVSIKANPDNCEVSIDGVFVDYPPILDKPLAEGSHTVSFKWPDGLRREEAVQVNRGETAYVTGRRQ